MRFRNTKIYKFIRTTPYIYIYRYLRDWMYVKIHKNSVKNESVIFQMPNLKYDCNNSARKMYKYIFFAECIEKYHLRFIPIQRCNVGKVVVLMAEKWAVLDLKYDFDDYFKSVIKSPERALIRKAIKKGYTVKEINYSDYMDEILEINLSKEERGGRPMNSDYTTICEWDKIVKSVNPNVFMYGCFNSEGHLVAYYLFQKHTNFFQTQKGIAHKDHLSMGVMNYLFAYSISELHKIDSNAILQYGLYGDSNRGLGMFKKHAGLQRKRLALSGTYDDFKNLQCFVKKYNIYLDCSLHYILDYVK